MRTAITPPTAAPLIAMLNIRISLLRCVPTWGEEMVPVPSVPALRLHEIIVVISRDKDGASPSNKFWRKAGPAPEVQMVTGPSFTALSSSSPHCRRRVVGLLQRTPASDTLGMDAHSSSKASCQF